VPSRINNFIYSLLRAPYDEHLSAIRHRTYPAMSSSERRILAISRAAILRHGSSADRNGLLDSPEFPR
jgi:hypothetical protein